MKPRLNPDRRVAGAWPLMLVALACLLSARAMAQTASAVTAAAPHASRAKAKTTAKPSAAKPAEPAGKSTDAPAPQPPVGAVGEFQPVLHAQQAKISTCMDTIVGQSAAVIDGTHTAISSWNATAPNDNVFLSIVGLSYADKTAPNAAAVIAAAPTGAKKCDGVTVQVYPVARSCSAVQAALIKTGRTVAVLGALPVVETKTGYRDVLLPTAGGGCTVVAIGLRQ